ncbi:MAG: valine--tRNA ligase, partial [Hyphomicrobiaceae bacterium]
ATITLPLVGRVIPIVADEYSDPEKGTGAVKITPAHDFNDFEVGKRQGLAQINVLDAHANILDDAAADEADVPAAYRGMERFIARQRIVEDMARAGLLAKIEPTAHTVPHGDRSHVVVEPWLTDQWYVNAEELAKEALAAVRSGKTKFVPERFAKDYYRWLENVQPWCISRQLWWGHQIPAWYDCDGNIFVGHDEKEAIAAATEKHGRPATIAGRQDVLNANGNVTGTVHIYRDEDVLDTWFSSALWPFSTLGWPDNTPELKRYYPTSVLVTGFDIIFFWVARMMMMGMHFMGEVPFRDVYIHGLVRDGQGNKMSKTRGNVIDPLDIIDGIALADLIAKRTAGLDKEMANRVEREVKKEFPEGIKAYGTDALRFTMAAMAAQGSDVKLSIDRVEGYRNFATKLWNAARFAEMNECVRQRDFDPAAINETVNRWIVGEVQRTAAGVTVALEAYRFNDAAASVYEFVWGVFCDWYLELIKPILSGDDQPAMVETRATTAWVLDQILKLLHPFMPFITEELWAHMVEYGERRASLLTLSQWPVYEGVASEEADAEIGWVINLISEVRSVRSEMNVPAGAKVPLVIVGGDKTTETRVATHGDTLKRLARLDDIKFAKSAPKGAAMIVAGETTGALPLEGIIDMDAERKRLAREIEKANVDIGKMNAKLDNPNFIERAKPEAIAEARERKAELENIVARLAGALKRLEA